MLQHKTHPKHNNPIGDHTTQAKDRLDLQLQLYRDTSICRTHTSPSPDARDSGDISPFIEYVTTELIETLERVLVDLES